MSYEIKAAELGTATLLVTPYLYTYDLVVLAVPLAFLIRLGGQRGFLAHERAGIGLACLLVLIFPFVKAPVGFLALLVVAALIARRAFAEHGDARRIFLNSPHQLERAKIRIAAILAWMYRWRENEWRRSSSPRPQHCRLQAVGAHPPG